MFTITKQYRFEAAHSLPYLREGHKCRKVHGHSYRFTVEVTGPLDANGFVIDYAGIDEAVCPVVMLLDHSNLNDILPVKTTAENIAQWIHEHIDRTTELRGHQVRVIVSETESTSAVYPA